MGKARLKMRDPNAVLSKAEQVNDLMNFSRSGALAQMFILDALAKGGLDIEHRARETNDKLVARLIKADSARVVAAVTERADAVAGAGLEAVREAFAKAGHGLVHPDGWHKVAVEIRDKLARST